MGKFEENSLYVPDYIKEKKKQGRTVPLYHCSEFEKEYGRPKRIDDIPLPSSWIGDFAIVMPDEGMEPLFCMGEVLVVKKDYWNHFIPEFISIFEPEMPKILCTVRRTDKCYNCRHIDVIPQNPNFEILRVDDCYIRLIGKVVGKLNYKIH